MKTPRTSRTTGAYCVLGNPRRADPGACTHAVRLRATRRPRAAKYQSLALLVAWLALFPARNPPLMWITGQARKAPLPRLPSILLDKLGRVGLHRWLWCRWWCGLEP